MKRKRVEIGGVAMVHTPGGSRALASDDEIDQSTREAEKLAMDLWSFVAEYAQRQPNNAIGTVEMVVALQILTQLTLELTGVPLDMYIGQLTGLVEASAGEKAN